MEEEDKKHYRFVNSKTGNVIAYFSIPLNADNETDMLETKRKELATEHGAFFETIYWEIDKKK